MTAESWLVVSAFLTMITATITLFIAYAQFRRDGHRIKIEINPNVVLVQSAKTIEIAQIHSSDLHKESCTLGLVRNLGGQPVVFSHISLVIGKGKKEP